MTDGLLSEILETERDIRNRISDLEQELKEFLDGLELQLERERQGELERCENECNRTVEEVKEAARSAAAALLADALSYASWIESRADADLVPIISRHLDAAGAGSGHDRPDEQA